MLSILKIIPRFFLDTLFPIYCLGCGKDDAWICDKCLETIALSDRQVCLFCEKIDMPQGKICPRCRNRLIGSGEIVPIDSLVFAVKYGKISKFIHLFKYNFVSDLSVPLGKMLVKTILKNNLPIPDFILPVPLHKKRLRWRGFNQSEMLAEYISQNITPGYIIPIRKDMIFRRRNTKPQMKIRSFRERKNNILGAFSLYSPYLSRGETEGGEDESNLKNKTILLIDDIATTGATLFEIGKLLKLSGAKKVFAAVLARQQM